MMGADDGCWCLMRSRTKPRWLWLLMWINARKSADMEVEKFCGSFSAPWFPFLLAPHIPFPDDDVFSIRATTKSCDESLIWSQHTAISPKYLSVTRVRMQSKDAREINSQNTRNTLYESRNGESLVQLKIAGGKWSAMRLNEILYPDFVWGVGKCFHADGTLHNDCLSLTGFQFIVNASNYLDGDGFWNGIISQSCSRINSPAYNNHEQKLVWVNVLFAFFKLTLRTSSPTMPSQPPISLGFSAPYFSSFTTRMVSVSMRGKVWKELISFHSVILTDYVFILFRNENARLAIESTFLCYQ